MANLEPISYEIYAGEVLGSDSEWSLLPSDGSITVYAGGTAKNIQLAVHTYLSVDYDDTTGEYAIADGVDLTDGGILNLYGGNAYNVKWIPFESAGVFFPMNRRSEITFSTEVSGVYYGRTTWSTQGSSEQLIEKGTTLQNKTLISEDDPSGDSGWSDIVYVMAGGALSDSRVLGGILQVYTGGIATGIVVGDTDTVGEVSVYGGTVSNISIVDGGISLWLAGSSGTDIVVCADGYSDFSLGDGSYFDRVSVESGARMHGWGSDGGGEFRNISVANGGEAVFYETDVIGLTVYGEAIVEVNEGTLSGSITITPSDPDGDHWVMLTNATLDFNISTVTASAAPRVNRIDWFVIDEGAVDYSITVSERQTGGVYALAGGADNFDADVTVVTAAGMEIGTISVGETLTYGDYAYTLDKIDSTLTLTVEGGSVMVWTCEDLNADGRADIVMTVTEEGHGAEGATGAWLIQEDQTAAWGDLSQRNAGWEIFGMGSTAADKPTSDVYVKSADNVIGAWVTDASGKVAGWETVGGFDANTQISGLGDFNGDGQTDLLLRNTNGAVGCYLTNGTGWNYFQSLGDEWTVATVGDFNGDGRDDVALVHDAGFAGCWITQSDCTMAWTDLDTLQAGFSVAGAGDFNGDGTSDVLLKTGNYYGAWIVEDGSVSSWMGLGDLGSVSVEQIADFDGDGKDDLRIRTAAGDLGAQLVKGADTLEWKYYGSVGQEWSTSLAAI